MRIRLYAIAFSSCLISITIETPANRLMFETIDEQDRYSGGLIQLFLSAIKVQVYIYMHTWSNMIIVKRNSGLTKSAVSSRTGMLCSVRKQITNNRTLPQP